jgi:hypothetical protein
LSSSYYRFNISLARYIGVSAVQGMGTKNINFLLEAVYLGIKSQTITRQARHAQWREYQELKADRDLQEYC